MTFPWFTSSAPNSPPPPIRPSPSATTTTISRSGSGRGGGGGVYTKNLSRSSPLSTSLPSSRLDDVRAKTRTTYLRKELAQSRNIDLSNSRGRLGNSRRVSIGSSSAHASLNTTLYNNAASGDQFRRRGVIVAVEPTTGGSPDSTIPTPPPSLSSSRHTPTPTTSRRMIDQGLIDASRSSQNPVLLGSTMIGGERERVMAAPSHAVKDESVLPTQHKRWWSMIPTIMGSEEKSNASKNTAHDADATTAAVTDTTTKLKHRRSVSYNTTYHVP